MQQLFKIVKKTNISKEIQEIKLFDDEDVNIISILLPFTIKDLERKAEAIKNKISEICSANKIDKCIIPAGISEKLIGDGGLFQVFSGETLFKSLLLLIIEEICKRKELMVNEADISVVQGNCAEELITFARILSPHIKYLTLITEFSNEIENEIDNLYAESGLSVSITSDISGGIRDKDIVINLGNMDKSALESRINQKAWIINYGNNDINKSSSRNIIINGVKINFPENIKKRIEDVKNVELFYESSQIAEACIYYKLLKSTAGLSFHDHNKLYEDVAREFTKNGFKISGLIGRHGLVGFN